jgi:hypothetical protein
VKRKTNFGNVIGNGEKMYHESREKVCRFLLYRGEFFRFTSREQIRLVENETGFELADTFG